MLLRVAPEGLDVSNKSVVRVLGIDGYHVAEAFLLNFRKTQERNMLSRVFSTVTKKWLGLGGIILSVVLPIQKISDSPMATVVG